MQIPFVLEEDEYKIVECISRANGHKLNWLNKNNDTTSLYIRMMLGEDKPHGIRQNCSYKGVCVCVYVCVCLCVCVVRVTPIPVPKSVTVTKADGIST